MKLQNVKILFLALLVVAPAMAKVSKVRPRGQKLVLQTRPEGYIAEEDAFYRTYIARADQGISDAYAQTWRFHEQQIKYMPHFQKDEHYTIGTQESYGNGKSDSALRNEFAEQVIRMRADAAFKSYFADKQGTIGKKAVDTVETLKDVRVKTAPTENGKQPEFSFGYDVMTDATRVEYVKGNIEAGIYHPKLTGSFMGRAQLVDANLRVWTNMDGTVPRTTVSLPVSANTFTTSVSQPLAKNVMGSLGTSQPLKERSANSSYDVTVAFTF